MLTVLRVIYRRLYYTTTLHGFLRKFSSASCLNFCKPSSSCWDLWTEHFPTEFWQDDSGSVFSYNMHWPPENHRTLPHQMVRSQTATNNPTANPTVSLFPSKLDSGRDKQANWSSRCPSKEWDCSSYQDKSPDFRRDFYAVSFISIKGVVMLWGTPPLSLSVIYSHITPRQHCPDIIALVPSAFPVFAHYGPWGWMGRCLLKRIIVRSLSKPQQEMFDYNIL
jgi:hypothetical protein